MTAADRPWHALPQTLAGRLVLTLSLTLLTSFILLALLWRAQFATSVVPPLAQSLRLVVENLRGEIETLPPPQRAPWIARRNARGDLQLKPLDAASPVAPPQRRGLLRSLEDQLNAELGGDIRLSPRSGRDRSLVVEFDAGGGRYAVTLPSKLVPRGFGLLGLFLTFGGLLWAALLFVVWQVNRPLSRVLAAFARSRDRLEVVSMPPSAPAEFRDFAAHYNALAARLAEQERERRILLAGVSHDLRAPLTRLRLRAELLDDGAAGAALSRDVESMRRIVDQFLDFHREPRAPAVVDAGDIAECAVGGFASLGHDLRLTRPGSALPVRADALALERVLSNLIDNALSHGAAPIEIIARRSADAIELQVRDHGRGIPPGAAERLVKPFERLDNARGAQGHCGLGLAIVLRLLQQNGGSLDLCNAAGGGLQATVRLPAVEENRQGLRDTAV